MDDQKRRVFLSQREVYDAGTPPVIGMHAEVQTISIVVENPPDEEETPILTETMQVYVELDADEIALLRAQGQETINTFGMRLGTLVASKLGGHVKRWRDVP